VPEPPPEVRWQALLVGVASNAHGNSSGDDPGFVQSLNSQAELAWALERSMPGLRADDLIVLPEPRYAREVTDAIALLNEAVDEDGDAGRVRPGLLFYYCGHGLDADGELYLSMVETIDNDRGRRRTGLAVRDVLETIRATVFKRPRVVLILDCCFAGLACEEKEGKRAHLLMAVGPSVKATHDPHGTGPTYFTAALVELMTKGDPELGPWIDLDAAFEWIGPRLVARHGQGRQPCQRAYRDSGAIILGRNPAFAGP
jgi:hypothetical protein